MSNPDPARITDEIWYLWEHLHALEPKSKLGGIYASKPGYHSTRADNQARWPDNYSITDAEDKVGPPDKAAAIDWTFPDAQAGDYTTIAKYSKRLLEAGARGDPRVSGWREFYGQGDTDTHVEGYDFRYGDTATSDPSHLWHIHLSCDRGKVASRANMDALLSVLRGDDMALDAADAKKVWSTDGFFDNWTWAHDIATEKYITPETALKRVGDLARVASVTGSSNAAAIADLAAKLDQVLAAIAAGVVVPAQVTLTPESVAEVADATADELRADPERDGD